MISSDLVYLHYKEPLKKIPKKEGVGYYGTILMSKKMDRIQCHICGELFESLGSHLNRTHGTTAKEYREKYQVARGTALISEAYRLRLKNRMLEWIKNMTPEEKEEYKRKVLAAVRKSNDSRPYRKKTPLRLEVKNKRGTCPDQLLDKIKRVAKELGRTPGRKEFDDYFGTHKYQTNILQTFGGWKNAVRMCGFEPYESKKGRAGYSKEHLLALLRVFYKRKGIIPSTSDFKRGVFPDMNVYLRNFGSIKEARKLAGIPEYKRMKGNNVSRYT